MSFFVVYRNKQGSRNRVKLGTYGQITLTQARDLAKQKLGAIASGIDPQQEKKAFIEEARQAKQDLTTPSTSGPATRPSPAPSRERSRRAPP